MRFSEDGRTLLAISRDGRLAEWETVTGRKIREQIVSEGIVLDATWSPDNQRCAAVYADNTLRMFDVPSGQLQEVIVGIEGLHGPVLRVGPSGDYSSPHQDRIWRELICIVQTEDGQSILTPVQFGAKYGWKNDPSAVPFLPDQQPDTADEETESTVVIPAPEPVQPSADVETGEPMSKMALVTQPAKLPGVKSWSIESKSPRRYTGSGKLCEISPDGHHLPREQGTELCASMACRMDN